MRNDTKQGAGKPRRKGGRPPAYDRDAALERVTEAFWRAGYSGTSLDQLARAAGMHRPSLYAAFGDKKAMYLAALDHFVETMRRDVGAALAAPSVVAAMSGFYRAALAIYADGATPKGCFVMATAVVEAETDPDIRAKLAEIVGLIDRGLEERLARAVAEGELDPAVDSAQLARLLGAVLHSLTLRIRAGQPAEALAALADDAVAALIRPRLR